MSNRIILFSIALLLLSFASRAQDVAYFQLAGRQLGSNTVYDIKALENGNVLAATEHGVARINMAGVKMLTSTNALRNSYTDIKADAKGQLYVINFRNQLYRITTDSLELFLDLTKEFDERVIGYQFWKETVLVYSTRSIKRYNIETRQPMVEWNDTIARQLADYDRLTFIPSLTISDSSIYFGNTTLTGNQLDWKPRIPSVQSGLRTYQRGNEQFTIRTTFKTVHHLPSDKIVDCSPYFNGSKLQNMGHTSTHFWVATNAGLLLFDSTLEDTVPGVVLEDYSISWVEEDLQNNYWIGTLNNGILVVPSVAIRLFGTSNASEESYSAIVAVPGSDSVIVGTKSGALWGIGESGKMDKIIQLPAAELYDLAMKEDGLYAIGSPSLWRLKNGTLETASPAGVNKQLSVLSNHLLGYSWYGSSLFPRDFKPDTLSNVPAFSIFESEVRNNALLASEPFQHLWARLDGSALLGANVGRCKKVTVNGISFIDSVNGTALNITDIVTDANNSGYVLAKDGSIYQIDSVSLELNLVARFTNTSSPEKLCVTDSLFLVYSAGQILYIERSSGMQHRFRNLIPFSSSELFEIVATPNNVWLAYASGIFKVPIAELADERQPLVKPLTIERDRNTKQGTIRVRLNYTDALAKHQLQYSYQLNNEAWVEMEHLADVLTLTNLAAGDYKLRVRVNRESTLINERSLTFSVAPPWHQTTWFIALLLLLVFFGTALFFRYRIRAIKKRNLVNQQLTEAQLTALKAQMNPHFLFNVLNSMQTMVLKEDKITANKIMSELSVFVRKILNFSGRDHIPLQDELEMLENYLKLEKTRFSEDFTYHFQVDENLNDSLHLNLPPMLIQPFVENAINHGLLHKKHDRRLTISFAKQKKQLKCVIEDNGVGRKKAGELQQKSKKHQSFASSASAQRIDLLKEAGHRGISITTEDLMHANQQPAGTRVTLILPLTIGK